MRRTKTLWRQFLTAASSLVIGLALTVAPVGQGSAQAADSTAPVNAKSTKTKSADAKKPAGKTSKSAQKKPTKTSAKTATRKSHEAYFARKLSMRVAHFGGSYATESFRSRGQLVRVDIVRAQNTLGKEAPAVIILHGASGLGDGTLYYPQARALADRGINAFVVHYFDGVADLPRRSLASPLLQRQRDEVIQDAISWVQSLPFVDADRIGAYGLSLGGFHVMDLAANDERVSAAVNVVGAMPMTEVRRGVSSLPPTLILHGEKDRVVPVRRAYELARLMDNIGAEYKLKVFKGQGHAFKGAALDESIQTTADFFQAHLLGAHAPVDKTEVSLLDQKLGKGDKLKIFRDHAMPDLSSYDGFGPSVWSGDYIASPIDVSVSTDTAPAATTLGVGGALVSRFGSSAAVR